MRWVPCYYLKKCPLLLALFENKHFPLTRCILRNPYAAIWYSSPRFSCQVLYLKHFFSAMRFIPRREWMKTVFTWYGRNWKFWLLLLIPIPEGPTHTNGNFHWFSPKDTKKTPAAFLRKYFPPCELETPSRFPTPSSSEPPTHFTGCQSRGLDEKRPEKVTMIFNGQNPAVWNEHRQHRRILSQQQKTRDNRVEQ